MGRGGGSALLVGPIWASACVRRGPACHLDKVTVGVQEEFMGRHDASQKRCMSQIELVVGG